MSFQESFSAYVISTSQAGGWGGGGGGSQLDIL